MQSHGAMGATKKKVAAPLLLRIGVCGGPGRELPSVAPLFWLGVPRSTHQRSEERGQGEEHQKKGQHFDGGVSTGVPGWWANVPGFDMT